MLSCISGVGSFSDWRIKLLSMSNCYLWNTDCVTHAKFNMGSSSPRKKVFCSWATLGLFTPYPPFLDLEASCCRCPPKCIILNDPFVTANFNFQTRLNGSTNFVIIKRKSMQKHRCNRFFIVLSHHKIISINSTIVGFTNIWQAICH